MDASVAEQCHKPPTDPTNPTDSECSVVRRYAHLLRNIVSIRVDDDGDTFRTGTVFDEQRAKALAGPTAFMLEDYHRLQDIPAWAVNDLLVSALAEASAACAETAR